MFTMRRRSDLYAWGWLLRQLTLAAFCVGLATSARAAVDPLIGDMLSLSAFYPAVLAATFWGGYGSGAAAFVLSSISGWTLFTPSRPGSDVQIVTELGGLAFFTVTTIIVALISQGQRSRDAFRRTLVIGGVLKVGSIPLGRPANDVTGVPPHPS
jgi:K+-sensing histidine kinase KdpD